MNPYSREKLLILSFVQELACKHPEAGLNPDKITDLSLDELLGVAAFLKRTYWVPED